MSLCTNEISSLILKHDFKTENIIVNFKHVHTKGKKELYEYVCIDRIILRFLFKNLAILKRIVIMGNHFHYIISYVHYCHFR
jgi:hypothetical protein